MATATDREDEIDSSDQEFVEPSEDNFSHIGAGSIERLRSNAKEARLRSKRASKELAIDDGSLGTQVIRARWKNRWEVFFAEVLGKDLENDVPTGKDVERFLLEIPHYLADKEDRGAVAHTYIEEAELYVIQTIRLRHDTDFRLTAMEKQRIKSVFPALLKEGLITQEPIREPQWLSAKVVARLILALFQDAIVNGVVSWCTIINGSLNLALLAAAGLRAGEAALSNYQRDDLACLCYKDVRIRLKDESSQRLDEATDLKLEAKITFRFEKGKKDKAADNSVVLIDSIGTHYADPLKLIIVQALRSGNIAGNVNSLTELINTTVSRRDRVIQWKFPHRPVVCKYGQQGFLLPDSPAGVHQADLTLNKAAALAGIHQKLRPHDIRRGAAADMSRLPNQVSLDNAGELLGHTSSLRDKKVTRKYVGAKRTFHNERMQLPEIDPFALRPLDEATLPAVRVARHQPTSEVSVALTDPAVQQKVANYKKPRAFVALSLRKKNLSEQNKHAQEAAADFVSIEMTATGKPHSSGAVATAECTVVEPAATVIVDKYSENFSAERREYHQSIEQDEGTANDGVLPSLSAIVMGGLVANEDFSPPKLQTWVAVGNGPISAGNRSLHGGDKLSSQTQTQIVQNDQEDCDRFLLKCSGTSFVDHFARRNDHTKANLSRLKTDHLVGGSRDLPTLKLFYCRNRPHGCTMSHHSRYHLVTKHEITCKADQPTKKVFVEACPDKGCNYIGRSESKRGLAKLMRTHEMDKTWTPKKCDIGGTSFCDNILDNITAVLNHKQIYHRSGWMPSACPIDPAHTHLFEGFNAFKQHLQRVHGLKGQELNVHLPKTQNTTGTKRKRNAKEQKLATATDTSDEETDDDWDE